MNKEYVIMNKNTFEIVENSNLIAIDSQLAKIISILNKKGYYVKMCSRARISKPFLITDLVYNLQSKNLLIINEETKKIIDQLDYESTLIIFKGKHDFNNIPKNFKLINTDSESHLIFNLKVLKNTNGIELKSLIEIDEEHNKSIKDLEIWAKKLPNN